MLVPESLFLYSCMPKACNFIKKEALEACNFIKKETLAQVFSCKFLEISKNILFTEHLRVTASALSPVQVLT